MEAQYGKFLDLIQAIRINLPLVDVLAGMPNYGKNFKELVSNKKKHEQILSTFLSDESYAMIRNKVPPKLGDPESFLIPCTFSKAFSCNALADLGASINLMPYSLYVKLSLETLKPIGRFTFPVDFIILEIEEDSKVPLILGRPFLYTADVVIQVKQKQLNLGVKEDFDALLDEGSEILHSNEGTILEEKLFAEFDEFMYMNIEENSASESNTAKIPFKKIIFNTNYKIKISLEEPPSDLERKPLHDHLEYVFLEEPTFFPLLEDKKPVVQKQRRLNLNMQEVVKKKSLNFSMLVLFIQSSIALGCMLAIFHDLIKESVEVFMDFSKIALPLIKLLEKDTPFEFNDECHKALNSFKEKLTCTPVIMIPNWNLPFELMCDASEFAVGAVLEFDIKIKDKKGTEIVATDHLSRIDNDETSDDSDVNDNFPKGMR
ncbi:reverse transcriptase domain-containing protein [Tanacetum coccineum]